MDQTHPKITDTYVTYKPVNQNSNDINHRATKYTLKEIKKRVLSFKKKTVTKKQVYICLNQNLAAFIINILGI